MWCAPVQCSVAAAGFIVWLSLILNHHNTAGRKCVFYLHITLDCTYSQLYTKELKDTGLAGIVGSYFENCRQSVLSRQQSTKGNIDWSGCGSRSIRRQCSLLRIISPHTIYWWKLMISIELSAQHAVEKSMSGGGGSGCAERGESRRQRKLASMAGRQTWGTTIQGIPILPVGGGRIQFRDGHLKNFGIPTRLEISDFRKKLEFHWNSNSFGLHFPSPITIPIFRYQSYPNPNSNLSKKFLDFQFQLFS